MVAQYGDRPRMSALVHHVKVAQVPVGEQVVAVGGQHMVLPLVKDILRAVAALLGVALLAALQLGSFTGIDEYPQIEQVPHRLVVQHEKPLDQDHR